MELGRGPPGKPGNQDLQEEREETGECAGEQGMSAAGRDSRREDKGSW